jgi:hypothetical protein
VKHSGQVPTPELSGSGIRLRQLRRLTNSALAGVSLTLVSFFYIGGVGFENRETGFPLQFSFRTDINGLGPLHFQLLLAVLDFSFWLAISYLFVSGVPAQSRYVRRPLEALVGVGVALFASVMVTGISYQTFSLPVSFYSSAFHLLNLAIGYIQIRRGFAIMGFAIAGTGIFLAALSIIT